MLLPLNSTCTFSLWSASTLDLVDRPYQCCLICELVGNPITPGCCCALASCNWCGCALREVSLDVVCCGELVATYRANVQAVDHRIAAPYLTHYILLIRQRLSPWVDAAVRTFPLQSRVIGHALIVPLCRCIGVHVCRCVRTCLSVYMLELV